MSKEIKVVSYEELKRDPNFVRYLQIAFRLNVPNSDRIRGDGNSYSLSISSGQLANLLLATGGNLGNKRIVDLGCGSRKSQDGGYTFQPYLCRALHYLGQDVTGVDLDTNLGEPFKSRQADLRKQDSLDFLASNSVDIFHTRALIDSPTLGVEDTPLERQFLDRLIETASKKAKDGGLFIYGRALTI